MGLTEAHQVLAMNNLRGRVTLRTDGGLRTGRDIVMAAMMGAEEYGIARGSTRLRVETSSTDSVCEILQRCAGLG
ncbi:glutamate synthase [NADPH] large chain [Ruegeria sp. TrichCH4B]|nr:glutamate synthase [NADPH] large chain [Ruegeria sp. TrichCH4B]